MRVILAALILLPLAAHSEERTLLWGDTHLHTTYSSDAYTNNNLTADPDTAYNYAKGRPVIHPYHRARVQIETPLDFLVVSDHAELLGGIRSLHRNGPDTSGLGLWDSIKAHFAAWYLKRAIDRGEGRELFVSILPDPALTPAEEAKGSLLADSDVSLLPVPAQIEIDTWRTITDLADKHNVPGEFTAFIGWEWSAIPAGANLHRIIVTDANAKQAQQFDPFGSDKSPYPEDIWPWLEETSAQIGADFTAIPHNSNISKGYMFSKTTLRGEPLSAEHMALRRKWERVAEITQIKGDSETHPDLSPDDEFADFETYPYYIQRTWTEYVARPGDYIRTALMQGLEIEGEQGVNPFMFGVIGSTDSHTSLPSAEENNFHGKLATDSIPENKERMFNEEGKPSSHGWAMSASGLAAVWARENTREAILDAFQERAVYATSGPRIRVEFFGGAAFTEQDAARADRYAYATEAGVPMGGEIGDGDEPTFLVMAAKDPVGANLDRIQVVKGWVDSAGDAHEKVYDVAWSGARAPGADGKLPAVGDTVNRDTGEVENSIGAPELAAVWTDPDFDPAQNAFYYARVLQIPTARHSLLDAIALGREHAGKHPDTIQERAYTSAIWYRAR